MWNLYTIIILAIVGVVLTKSFCIKEKRLLFFGLIVLAFVLFGNAYSVYFQVDNAYQITRLILNFEKFDQLSPLGNVLVNKYNQKNIITPIGIVCFHFIIDLAVLAIVYLSNEKNIRKEGHRDEIEDT